MKENIWCYVAEMRKVWRRGEHDGVEERMLQSRGILNQLGRELVTVIL